jgi:hypothetical protein
VHHRQQQNRVAIHFKPIANIVAEKEHKAQQLPHKAKPEQNES